jgi:hypothetical protein
LLSVEYDSGLEITKAIRERAQSNEGIQGFIAAIEN